MTSESHEQPGDTRLEHFDNPELNSGARDTGDDAAEHGQAGRPIGDVDEDANPPMSDPGAPDVYGGTGDYPPYD